MLQLLSDDVELEFVGLPTGTFRGLAAVATAYRTQPPDDEVHLEERDGRITHVRVLYEQFSA